MLGNSLRIDSMVDPAYQVSKLSVVSAGVDAVDVLMLDPFDTWTETPAS
jgi:hypothetical protein